MENGDGDGERRVVSDGHDVHMEMAISHVLQQDAGIGGGTLG